MKVAIRRPLARPLARSLVAVTIVLFAAVVARAQESLQQIPDDALVVGHVKNVAATSTKLGKMLTELGLAAMQPGLDNPLGFFQSKSGITKGLRTTGDLAIIYRDPDKTGETPDKSMVILVPVNDYDAFVSNFAEPKVEGDITTVQMPQHGGDGFIMKSGDFALLTPSKTLLEHKPAGMLKITDLATLKEFSTHDAVVYLNMNGLRPKAQMALQQGQAIASGQIEQALAKEDKAGKFTPMVKAIVDQFFATANAFVRDASAITFSVNFDDDGISDAAMVEFTPGSYCGNIVSSIRNTEQPMLAGLPSAKYLFYAGMVNNPEVTVKLLSDAMAPVMKELDAIGPEMKPAHDYCDAFTTYLKVTKGGSFGIVAPAGQIGQESVMQVLSIARGDAQVMKDSQIKMMKSQEALMKSLGLPVGAYSVEVTPNAKTIEGVSFDQIATKMDAAGNDPKARQQQQMMAMIYGPNGMNMLEGVSGDNFIFSMGVPEDVLTSAVQTIKSGASPMHDSVGVKAVASHLPASRVFEGYIPLDQIATTALGYFKTFGMPINVNVPPNLPPIAISALTDGTAMRGQAYVPTELVKRMVAAGMQAYMQAQGGGGSDKDSDSDKDNGK